MAPSSRMISRGNADFDGRKIVPEVPVVCEAPRFHSSFESDLRGIAAGLSVLRPPPCRRLAGVSTCHDGAVCARRAKIGR